MLPLVIRRSKWLSPYRFGAVQPVTLNQNATWIRHRSDPSLACFEGIEQTHVLMPDPDTLDPYEATKDKPWFSLDRLLYEDIYHHDNLHDERSNRFKGYAFGDDPMDSRTDIQFPFIVAISAVMVMATIGSITTTSYEPTTNLRRGELARFEVMDRLTSKKEELEALRQEEAELKSQL